jgi:hypothetical protein
MVSDSQELLDPIAINKSFASDYMYWTKAMALDAMKKMLANSLCFGLYEITENVGMCRRKSILSCAAIMLHIPTFRIYHHQRNNAF